jgi:prepilin-type N-terminal cleavage/methylation domain-containing protein
MKNIQKGFTLVELIVVITILAILGTIAFISLQGYSQDAKNAKVSSDLATLAKSIDIANTDGSLSMSALISGDNTTVNGVTLTDTVTIYDAQNNPSTGSLTSSNYQVGTVNFPALRQNGDDFLDPQGNPYVAAVAYSGGTAYYQLAGQQKEASGEYTAIVKGNYVPQSGDVTGLISASGAVVGVTHKQNLGDDVANTNLY